MPTTFDAIVIGAGQSGPSLADRLVKSGLSVAVIERQHFGGTCVNVGCVPTKTLVASAYVAHMARRAAEYGVDAGPVAVDMKRVKARKDAIVMKSRNGVASWMERRTKVYRGHARLTGPRLGGCQRRGAGGGAHHYQHRRSRVGAADARSRHGALPHEQHAARPRRRARASRHRRRQLHRARVRAGLSPLRRRGDRHRDGGSADRARGPRRFRGGA